MYKRLFKYLFLVVFILKINAQETIPVNADYLVDNIFLIHPASAGFSNCAKLRMSHRQQWFGIDDAPQLQTLSYHSKLNTNPNVGLGALIFKDQNGAHSQLGVQATFAYHIDLTQQYLSQLSFAISGAFAENKVNETNFILINQIDDPVISNLVKSKNYYNVNVGMAYHYKTGYAYFTAKNLILNAQNKETSSSQFLNLRSYLVSVGYYFDSYNERSIKLEPSTLIQYNERNKIITADINLKAYKKLRNDNILWVALSYRQSFDKTDIQELTQFSPIIGFNFKNTLFSYTFTQNTSDIKFESGGFHQLTLGFNLFCNESKINSYN
jgi:type IX secretion system PorP/SprF family membrane protein